jgi:hypothetical protein
MEESCEADCEVVGGPLSCGCVSTEGCGLRFYPGVVRHVRPAPFTGTPYDPDSEED